MIGGVLCGLVGVFIVGLLVQSWYPINPVAKVAALGDGQYAIAICGVPTTHVSKDGISASLTSSAHRSSLLRLRKVGEEYCDIVPGFTYGRTSD